MAQYDLTPYQREILIRTALGENRGHGEDGMADVIQNVINRANSGRYPSDPAAVALQPKQYSTWNKGEGGNNPQQFKPGTAIWTKAERALEAVLGGRPDPTGGALDYHASNISPYWASSKDRYGTITRNGHTFYPTHPVPPGEIHSVGTFLDTVRMPPQPASQSGSVAFRRQNTSPLGDNTALPGALAQYAQRQANQVTPAIRRPSLPPMGTPDVNALYAGIYPQAPRTNAPQSTIERGAARIPPVRGNLTDPGAIDASVNGLSQNQALQAALSRRIASPAPVPQSQIERTQLPIGQSQIERTALPRDIPPDLISQSMQRIASANPVKLPPIAPSPIGQPPSTRMVQSVAMPPLGTAPSRMAPRVTVSTPYTVPQRMAGQDIGNVPRALPQATPFVPEQRYIEPRNVAPVQRYQGPFVPNKGLERLATPTALSFNPIQQPPAFTTQMQPTQVLNPAWSATPASIPPGTPMSGGLSRDAVALRAKGLAAAQAMANVPKYITVQKPVQVPVRIPTPVPSPSLAPSRVAASAPSIAPLAAMTPTQQAQNQLGLTSAQAYAFLNSFSGGPRTAADRPGKSLSQSGGSGGIASW